MTSISTPSFNGIAPAVSSKLLNGTHATTASNVVLHSGAIEPLKSHEPVGSVATTIRKSIYLMDSNWLEWNEDFVRVVRSPVVNSVDDTFYFTGVDYPRVSWSSVAFTAPPYPAASYRLGVPAPPNEPSIASTTGTPDTQELVLDIAWVYTFVTADGREGPPSPPSAIAYAQSDNLTYTLLLPDAVPAGNHNFGAGALRRVYRANTGTDATAFQFAGEVPIGTTAFNDTLSASQLQEVIPSNDWTGPPDDDAVLFPEGPLQGLCDMGNGILAGFSGRTLWFSEAFLPHAWPATYALPMTDDIINIAATTTGLVVFTTGTPSIIIGRDPLSLTQVKLPLEQSCVSRDSVVTIEDNVMYASPDGLVGISGMSASLLTEPTHDRADWQALVPSTIKGFYHERRYIGFYDDGVTPAGFIFDPVAELNNFTQISAYYTDGYNDLYTDTLYLLDSDDIDSFNSGSALTLVWKSKEFELPAPSSFSCGVIDASGALTFKFYADGVQLGGDIAVTGKNMFRLPAATSLYQTIQYEVSGAVTINSVKLATSTNELAAI